MIPLIWMTLENDEDRALIEDLYLQYHNLMYAQALRVLKNRPAAEDAVSDALEALIKKVSVLREMDGNKRKAYAVITVRHMAVNIYRRRGRETVADDDALNAVPADRGTEDAVLDSAGVDEIREAIHRLGAMDRDILMMRYFREMSDTEISRELSVLPVTVRVRMSRARKHLATLLRSGEAWE